MITTEQLDDAEDIRKDRALAEYGDFASHRLDANHVQAAADVAERIVDTVASALANHPPARRPRRR